MARWRMRAMKRSPVVKLCPAIGPRRAGYHFSDAMSGMGRYDRDPHSGGRKMLRAIALVAVASIAAAAVPSSQVSAQDKPQDKPQDTIKVATGQRGNWNAAIGELGQRAGI